MINIIFYILSAVLVLISFGMLIVGGSSKRKIITETLADEPPRASVPDHSGSNIIVLIFFIMIIGGTFTWWFIQSHIDFEKTNTLSTSISMTTNQKEVRKWETVGNFPIPLKHRTLNLVPGKNGERAGTGEAWIPYVLLPKWEYRITFSGEYQKKFWSPVWKNIKWFGDNSVAGQNVRKPFKIPYGALVLRIGKTSVFPAKGTDNVSCAVKEVTKIFAELNVNREPGEYFTPKLGFKLRNKNLSIKIERRRLKKE